MKQAFQIQKYSPAWKNLYLAEREDLVNIFKDALQSIHHIGSTAIPHTCAKPEIDILVVIENDATIASYDQAIEALGYKVRGECLENGGTPGRFYYSKDLNNVRTHKLHVCQIGHSEIMAKLLFVKYLNDHKEVAIEYAQLKTELSKVYNYGKHIEKYLEGKSDFIKKVLEKANQENKDLNYEDFI